MLLDSSIDWVDTRLKHGRVGASPFALKSSWDALGSALMGQSWLSKKGLMFQQVRYSINSLISIVLAPPAWRSCPKPVRANRKAHNDFSDLQNMLWFHQDFLLVQLTPAFLVHSPFEKERSTSNRSALCLSDNLLRSSSPSTHIKDLGLVCSM